MNRIYIGLLLLSISFGAQSQESWSLQRCIEHALENNLNIKQSKISSEIADINVKQAKQSSREVTS